MVSTNLLTEEDKKLLNEDFLMEDDYNPKNMNLLEKYIAAGKLFLDCCP